MKMAAAKNKRMEVTMGDIMKILFRTIVFLLLLVSVSQGRLKHVPIEEMPSKADFAIVGTVVDSNSRWGDRGLMIFTDYTIEIEQSIFGDAGREIIMSFAGGSIGDDTVIVTHTPLLSVGQTYIIFGYEGNKYSVPVVGHEQGIFHVIRDMVDNDDFIIDYNWYRLEITDQQEAVRGPSSWIDDRGALAVSEPEETKKAPAANQPVIRDIRRRRVMQDRRLFKKPMIRKRGKRATKKAFIDFIRRKRRRPWRVTEPQKLQNAIEKLSSVADFGVMGKVVNSGSRWDEKGETIFTDYKIAVEQVILGYTPEEIVITFNGGTIGDRTILVVDGPLLKVGEKYVIFGQEGKKGRRPLVGRQKSVFRVVNDKPATQDLAPDKNVERQQSTDEEDKR